MKNLILAATLLIGFQANAIYADKLIPRYSCKTVESIPGTSVSVVLTQSPMSQVMILNVYSRAAMNVEQKSFMVQPQISITTQATFSNDQVGLTIQLLEELEDGTKPAVFMDERGATIDMACSPVRTVLKM